MALHVLINTTPGQMADIYREFRSTNSKLQKTASSFVFNEHAFHHHVTPKFLTTLRRQFSRTEDKMKAERSVLFSHLKVTKNLFAVYLNNMMNELTY